MHVGVFCCRCPSPMLRVPAFVGLCGLSFSFECGMALHEGIRGHVWALVYSLLGFLALWLHECLFRVVLTLFLCFEGRGTACLQVRALRCSVMWHEYAVFFV